MNRAEDPRWADDGQARPLPPSQPPGWVDPDPLNTPPRRPQRPLEPVRPAYYGWDPVSKPVSHAFALVGLGICIGIILFALLITVGAAIAAAPRPAPVIPSAGTSEAPAPATPGGAGREPTGAPQGQAAAGLTPGPVPGPATAQYSSGAQRPRPGSAPSGGTGGPKYSASATWCAPTPRRCQSWGDDAKVAGVYSFTFGVRPYWARVWRGAKFTDVVVVSHCACQHRHDRIDLSPFAFAQLTLLSRGRIDVDVELLTWPYEPGGDPPPHPADERMRVEVRGDELYR